MASLLLPLFQAIDAEWIGTEVLQPNLYHFIDCFYSKSGRISSREGCWCSQGSLGKGSCPLVNQHHPEFPRDGTTGSWLEKGLKQTLEINLGPVPCFRELVRESRASQARKEGRAGPQTFTGCKWSAQAGRSRSETPLAHQRDMKSIRASSCPARAQL